jgi:hypothetical protein
MRSASAAVADESGMMNSVMRPFLPSPAQRGEGAERSEAGEGQELALILKLPLIRLASSMLATFSPQVRGEGKAYFT